MHTLGGFLSLFISVSFLFSLPTHGQQSPLYTQYLFNGLLVNPAYAGSHESMSISGLFRKQWTGLTGSPTTETLTAHSPLNNKHVGLGLVVMNDDIGVTRQSGIDGIYAYRIFFTENKSLSFGLQAGYARLTSQYHEIALKDPNDPSFSGIQASYDCLFFGTGMYYSATNFYFGLSSPRLSRVTLNESGSSNESRQSRNYFLSTGYVVKISPAFKLKPGALVRTTNEWATQMDLNCTLLYEDLLWVGISYRTKAALCFLAKINLTNQLSAGYAYDYTLDQLQHVSKGGHELMLTYNFLFFKSNTITPRDF